MSVKKYMPTNPIRIATSLALGSAMAGVAAALLMSGASGATAFSR